MSYGHKLGSMTESRFVSVYRRLGGYFTACTSFTGAEVMEVIRGDGGDSLLRSA